jgi:cold shock CspA family protein
VAVKVTAVGGGDCERMARKGTVAKWVNHKGIGFITPGDHSEDILVHHSAIKQNSDDGFVSLKEGERTIRIRTMM